MASKESKEMFEKFSNMLAAEELRDSRMPLTIEERIQVVDMARCPEGVNLSEFRVTQREVKAIFRGAKGPADALPHLNKPSLDAITQLIEYVNTQKTSGLEHD